MTSRVAPVKLYRKMLVDAEGRPLVGNASGMLGVRLGTPAAPKRPKDVDAELGTDAVRPGKGLSVDADPAAIPPHVEGVLWVLDESAVPPGLSVPQRGKRPTHHQIEPAAEMTLDAYQQLLWSTRAAWVRVPEGDG